MQVTHSTTIGWPWFGIGKIRYHVTETGYYTMWMLFLTTKFAVGFHVGGTSRMSEEEEKELLNGESNESPAGKTDAERDDHCVFRFQNGEWVHKCVNRCQVAKQESECDFIDWELTRQSREEAADEEMFAECLGEQQTSEKADKGELPDDIDYDRAESSMRAFEVPTSTARAASEERETSDATGPTEPHDEEYTPDPSTLRPCCKCGTMLESASFKEGDWECLQPYRGGEIQLLFGFGSTKFDCQLEGTVFRGIICDDCAEKLVPNMFLASESRFPFHGDSRGFNRELPREFKAQASEQAWQPPTLSRWQASHVTLTTRITQSNVLRRTNY